MRIAHVISTPAGLGGAEQVLVSLVEAGGARGYEQLVLNPFVRHGQASALTSTIPDGLLRARACEHLWELPGLRAWTHNEIRAFDPDIVHVHLFHAQVLVTSIPRGREVRLLTHHHGSVLRIEGGAHDRLLDRVTGRRYDQVVAVSEEVRRFLIGEYGYDPWKVTCIRNGWEGSPVDPATRSQTPRLVCVANFRPQKGHSVLIEAFSMVRREIPEAELILIGDGELRSATEKRVAELGLGSSVTFAGPVDDVWGHLSEAWLMVLASLYEPLGIVVMEAMAAGLPVVASGVGGIPELVQDRITGFLVPPGEAEPLADRMIRLIKDPEMRSRMGAQAREEARRLTMAEAVERYDLLYRTSLGQGAG